MRKKMSEVDKKNDLSIRLSDIDVDDPRYKKYLELKRYMEIPAVEQIIFAKLEEIKRMFQKETK
jgi:hypothetical protein